jgi:hypothetical protein
MTAFKPWVSQVAQNGFGLRSFALLSVGGIEARQIAIDAGFDLLHPPLDLIGGEVLVAVVNRLDPRSIWDAPTNLGDLAVRRTVRVDRR